MLNVPEILDSARRFAFALVLPGVALLGGCGQKGTLYVPKGEAASQRATLPQTINPASPSSAPPVTGTASPAPRP